MISEQVDKAIGFAARAHAGQRRKRGNMPVIAHPFGVAMILLGMDCDENTIAAALLHDTIEDTSVSMEEIQAEFGEEIAAIVAACTEPQGKKWEIRKQTAIAQYREAPLRVKLVGAADKYHNLYHLQRSKQKNGQTMWKGFSRDEQQQAWYYRAVVSSLLENNPESDRYPIFAELASLVDELFEGVPSQAPDAAEL
ncbi:MAG: HD domain-containing protein [Anaerolineae bacterium]|nr:HD domain-containing protein [Anaerolineae bacterium]MCO5193698.1 HD domain-containing protein [Anaerolineae bacterium]MCO5206570.1 HD domain-containing protein [Anaerolineae bacterium]